MYKLLLISKYLRRKLAPLFAALAVTICTAMVIIVISVMGGFLDTMRSTAKTLTADVTIRASLAGFPHYEDLIARLEAQKEIDLATPTIEAFALMQFDEYSNNVVQVRGIAPREMAQIINYDNTLLWTGEDIAAAISWNSDEDHAALAQALDLQHAGQHLQQPALMQIMLSDGMAERVRRALLQDPTLRQAFLMSPGLPEGIVRDPRVADQALVTNLESQAALPIIRHTLVMDPAVMDAPGFPQMPEDAPGLVIGVATNPYQRRDKDGVYHFENPDQPYYGSRAGQEVSLTLVPFSSSGKLAFEPVRRDVAVLNEFKSGYFENDKLVVYAPLDWLQTQLKMNASEGFTDYDNETGLGGDSFDISARVHHIEILAAQGYSADEVARVAQAQVDRFLEDHPDIRTPLHAETWEQKHGQLLGAVENEKGLVTFLFGIISIVAVVMVATTFYMIVLEKTRDIGVLRAIGAPAVGVLNLFLTYGLLIGMIGALAGVWLAWFIVTNLNNLQDALANRMVTLIAAVVLSILFAGLVAAGLGILLRKRDFSLGSGLLVFLLTAVGVLTLVYYGFPSITLPGAQGYDAQYGWKMWDPQMYFFERIPDKVVWTEVKWIALGAVLSSVIGAAIPAVIAARLNPIEALRYE